MLTVVGAMLKFLASSEMLCGPSSSRQLSSGKTLQFCGKPRHQEHELSDRIVRHTRN